MLKKKKKLKLCLKCSGSQRLPAASVRYPLRPRQTLMLQNTNANPSVNICQTHTVLTVQIHTAFQGKKEIFHPFITPLRWPIQLFSYIFISQN